MKWWRYGCVIVVAAAMVPATGVIAADAAKVLRIALPRAEKGFDPANGARPLGRVIENEVKRPLGDELLFGKLENGGHVVVDVKDKTIVFTFRSADATAEKALLH